MMPLSMPKRNDRKVFAIKLPPRRYHEFAVAADMLGNTRAGYLHPLIVKLIRQERERDPERFDELVDERIRSLSSDELEPAGEIETEPTQ